ncbi:acetate/propionate family kinase [Aestuariibius sp. 2305UL40-4]|uniref:acetate/propionate family kinase n=1 Tax=Aestuariibius violaceus TaxID=3234132 RepID=UPI00345E8E13
MAGAILVLNAGSSSLKFAVYEADDDPARLANGQVERLGPAAVLHLKREGDRESRDLGAADHRVALTEIMKALGPVLEGRAVRAVGHRVVHGGVDFAAPVVITSEIIEKLQALVPLAPLHQPHNLAAIEAATAAFPNAAQIACFDTAFHRGHPWVNDTFALPRHFYEEGVRRYGFHGLSYDFITGELQRRMPELARGRVVIAHLGNGASLCAVREGRSVGSTMGFSALDGLPMGTRCGQIDPGVLLYLAGEHGMSVGEISTLLYRESGLKGLSGISGDMRTLEASDLPEAKEAIDYYVFRLRREIGAMAAVLQGLDAIVFTGGIGENSARIRQEVCAGLGFLGVEIDPRQNAAQEEELGVGAVRILRLATDEERVIARAAGAVIR